MDQLSTYRCKIGTFYIAALQKSAKRTSVSATNQISKARKTSKTDIKREIKQQHWQLWIILCVVYLICGLVRNTLASVNEKSVFTLTSSKQILQVSYRNITRPPIKDLIHVVSLCDNLLFYCMTVLSQIRKGRDCSNRYCHNYALLNHREITWLETEVYMCTAISCYNYALINYRNNTSLDNKPVWFTITCHNHTHMNYRRLKSPLNREVCRNSSSFAEGTCYYLIGNKGCHSYNGNPKSNPEREACLTPETLHHITKHVAESVCYITTTTSAGTAHATGYSVGDCYIMTAYHVFRTKLDDMLQDLAMKFDRCSEKEFLEVCKRLRIKAEKDHKTSSAMAVKRVFITFLRDTAANTSLLLQRLEGLVDTECFKKNFEINWKRDCIVDFVDSRRYTVDWRVEFGVQDSDIIIVKLLAEAGQTFPKPMLLDENFREHGDIQVIRYIHGDAPKIIIDQNTKEFYDDSELQKDVQTAVQMWEQNFPDEPKNFFYDCYHKCRKPYDKETGHVVLRTSKSFTYGASGSPIVYSFNSTGQPIAGMIFQRGHPEFYYNARFSQRESDRKFQNVDTSDKDCLFFDGGTTMKKAAQLLNKYGKYELKQNIFSLPAGTETRTLTLQDLDTTLQRIIAQTFATEAAEIKEVQRTQARQLEVAVKALENVDGLAKHGALFDDLKHSMKTPTYEQSQQFFGATGSTETCYDRDTSTATLINKMPSDDMVVYVEKWKEDDRHCYVTKGVQDVLRKISSDKHSYISVLGVPGSGKSTALRHAALYLKDELKYAIYPITNPKEFNYYFDRQMHQLFIIDDVIGEYFVDKETLRLWDKYNDRVKSCLEKSKNTKFITSLRVQVYADESLKGKTYIFNDICSITNLSDEDFKLSSSDMQNMLRHCLRQKGVGNVERLITEIWWSSDTTGKCFVDCFPLMCKVFSENPAVRVKPEAFFRSPVQALTDIFRQIKSKNIHQFCGLLLCAVTELKDKHLSPFAEPCNKQQKVFDSIIKSQNLDPEKDLLQIKESLHALEGIYISHVGNRYIYCHSIFHNIVTFLCNDKYFVFKFATRDFIKSRVRLFSKRYDDDDFVLVFHDDECIELLVDRMICELKSDNTGIGGVRFIVYSPYINNEKLLSRLISGLFDNNDADITQDMVDALFRECLLTVKQDCSETQGDGIEQLCPCYKLLVSLIRRVDCNRHFRKKGWWRYPIHYCISTGSVALTKLLVEHNADINVLDIDGSSVLHWAVNCENNIKMTTYLLSLPNLEISVNHSDESNKTLLHQALECKNNVQMTKYLLSLPDIACLNERDSEHKTPYWYVLHNDNVPNKQSMILIYRQRGGIE